MIVFVNFIKLQRNAAGRCLVVNPSNTTFSYKTIVFYFSIKNAFTYISNVIVKYRAVVNDLC